MDRKPWLLMLCVLGLILLASGQKPLPNKDEPWASQARYQLIPAQVGKSGEPRARLFMIDTQDGKIWKYYEGSGTGKSGYPPEAFVPVGIGIPTQGTPDWGLKSSAREDSRH
jgi:hypothetical protein